MIPPHLQSERFSALGNVVSEGIWNQLGRPELDRLALLVRESAQNSWDARTGDTIEFRIDSFALTRAQSMTARDFFRQTPPPAAYESTGDLSEPIQTLQSWLESTAPRLLLVSDRGTRGLDGPTRADRDAPDGEERNFVDFLRNVGQPPTKAHGGGTFGYGKAAFYLASETRTIIVYTRCRHRGRLEERLSAAALTHNFSARGIRYTGRHWWGREAEGAAEPILDADARQWASGFGLPTFDGDECGTTIAVVAPTFSDEALRGLPTLCLRNLWPKLRPTSRGRAPLAVRLSVSGHELPVPDPATTPPYNAFYAALQRVRSGDAEPITYRTKVTGRVAFQQTFATAKPEVPGAQADASELPEHETRPRHIALLRAPEIVVKYLEAGRAIAADAVGFAGVFLADPDEDRAFALSEPPSHDDWQAASVRDDRARGIVKNTLQKIRSLAKDFAAPHAADVTVAQGTSLAQLSSEFADLLPGLTLAADNTSRPGPSAGPEPGQRRTRGSKPTARLHETSELQEIDGVACAVFRVDVTHAAGSDRTTLRGEVFAMLGNGGRETEGPRGTSVPEVGWWESPRGARTHSAEVTVGARQQGTWSVVVPVREPIVLGLEVYATRSEASS